MLRNVQLPRTGSDVPERSVTNAEVDALLGKSMDEWLVADVGSCERRWMTPDQVTSDLIVEATGKALRRAGIAASDLDLIIVSFEEFHCTVESWLPIRPPFTLRGQSPADTRQPQRFFKWPVVQIAIQETGIETIPCPNSIDHVHRDGCYSDILTIVDSKSTLCAQFDPECFYFAP